MSNYSSIKITQRLSCTAFELSVAQVLSLLFAAQNLTLPQQQEEFDALIVSRILSDVDYLRFSENVSYTKLKEGEIKKAIDLFYNVNDAFFNPKLSAWEQAKLKKKKAEAKPIPMSKVYQDLAVEIEIYTRWGHPATLNYPWSLFLVIKDNFQVWQEKVKNQTKK